MQTFSTSQMMQQFREKAKTPGASVRKEGDASAALAGAARKIEAVYEVAVSLAPDDGAAELRCGPAAGLLRSLDRLAIPNR